MTLVNATYLNLGDWLVLFCVVRPVLPTKYVFSNCVDSSVVKKVTPFHLRQLNYTRLGALVFELT